MFRRHSHPNRQRDYLDIRLRRMAQELIHRSQNSTPELNMAAKGHRVVRTTIWALFLGLCIALFVFQSCERIAYYFTYPVAFDVSVTNKIYQMLPEITICNQGNKGFFFLQSRMNYSTKFWLKEPYPILSLLAPKYRINSEAVWRRMNTSLDLISAKEVGVDSKDLMQKNVPMLYGTCETFKNDGNKPIDVLRGRYEIILNISTPNSPLAKFFDTLVFIHDPGESPLSRKRHVHTIGKKNEVGITITRVRFLNRTGKMCVSGEDYEECLEACREKFEASLHLTCRLPFQDASTNIPLCWSSAKLYTYWRKMNAYLSGVLGEKEPCLCTRKCEHRIFNERDVNSKLEVNQSVHVLRFDDPYETLIQDRFLYDIISLLCDIGGNSGLYIGLSILSVFELFTKLYARKKNIRRCIFSLDDPLYRKVVQTYNDFKNSMSKIPRQGSSVNCSKFYKTILLTVCTGVFTFSVVNRTLYYFEYPIRIVLDISFNTSIYAPAFIFCYETPKIIALKKKFASLNNRTEFCDVKAWDLLHLPQVNVSQLWIPPWNKTGQYNNFPPDVGLCHNMGFGREMIFAGKDLLLAPSQLNLKIYGASNRVPCGTKNTKAYIKPASKYFDYLLYIHPNNGLTTRISYTIKEIRIDGIRKDCIEERVYQECKIGCLHEKLWERVSCRLPYMRESSLPLCNSSQETRQSHLTFLDLFISQANVADCRCSPPCRTQFYDVQITTEESNQLHYTFGAAHGVIISFVYQPAYTFIKLLCDIGGWIGATLGLCMISVVNMMISMLKLGPYKK